MSTHCPWCEQAINEMGHCSSCAWKDTGREIGGEMSKRSLVQGVIWIDGSGAKTVGDVRRFVRECDNLGVRDDHEIVDDLFVQVKAREATVSWSDGYPQVTLLP